MGRRPQPSLQNPFENLEPLNASIDPKHVRRALGPEDLRKLVLAAHNGPALRRVTGPVRALAWRLGCEAGLRISEICGLQAGDLDLDAPSGPMLTVRASVSKNRKEARLPLHGVLAHDLAPYTRGKLPTASLLGLPASFRHRATFWIERDLAAAGLEYEDASGHVADVHSLRSAFITNLVRSGANVKAVQLLARHASPTETLGIYTRLVATEERDAISRLQVVSPSGVSCAP
ncbi:MAG: site-specific integrase [Planctomycetes bacterium]|nr:site-specific integrase [Planctomycetota bacterium]